MITWEYVLNAYSLRDLNALGAEGWKVHHVDVKHGDYGDTKTYYLRRRTDRRCATCMAAVEAMTKLEQVVP